MSTLDALNFLIIYDVLDYKGWLLLLWMIVHGVYGAYAYATYCRHWYLALLPFGYLYIQLQSVDIPLWVSICYIVSSLFVVFAPVPSLIVFMIFRIIKDATFAEVAIPDINKYVYALLFPVRIVLLIKTAFVAMREEV